MKTEPLTMPEHSPQKRTRWLLWAGLGGVLLICLVLAYLLYTSQGFHDVGVVDNPLEYSASQDGLFDIAVYEGQRVEAGTYLGSVDGAALKERLATLERQLVPLELALPLEYGGYTGVSGQKEVAPFSDEALRQAVEAEKTAREAVQKASAWEAKRGLEARKYLQRHYQGQVGQEQLETVRGQHAQAQSLLSEAKKMFEIVSLERAGIEKERARIRLIQEESGLEAVPVEVRIKEYEIQKAKRDKARAEYEQSVFFSPSLAVVVGAYAASGQHVEQGQPLLTLRPLSDFSVTVTALTSRHYAKNLLVGGDCTLDIPTYSSRPLQGIITAIVPQESGWRSILPEALRWSRVYITSLSGVQNTPLPSDAKVIIQYTPALAPQPAPTLNSRSVRSPDSLLKDVPVMTDTAGAPSALDNASSVLPTMDNDTFTPAPVITNTPSIKGER